MFDYYLPISDEPFTFGVNLLNEFYSNMKFLLNIQI